ncbi:MAG: SpoIID/LytB domain-containing protein [Clostridia bacterium]|jgi:stage II sporulation protein D|nr:SpoIID/LytB domain-containing protein [Clostridia bacterium]
MSRCAKPSFILPVTLFIFLLTGLLHHPTVATAAFSCPQGSIRVALALNLSSGEFSVNMGAYELIDYATQRVISPSAGDGVWLVAPLGNQNIQIANSAQGVQNHAGSIVMLRQKEPDGLNLFQYKNTRYRGDLLLENVNGSIHVINVVKLEQYLYGVVGPELGFKALPEAYKAQAVVSRTYALYRKQYPQLNYDIGMDQQTQVYAGYEGELNGGEAVKSAVDATAHLAVYFDNQLIQPFFHSNSGGYTESCENVWSAQLPYLRPVATPEDAYVLNVSQSQGWPANTYQWEKSYTKQELLDRINKWNASNSQEKINVGTLQDIVARRQAVDPVTKGYLSKDTASGRVTQLDFVGSNGVKSFFRDGIRAVFELRSTLFQLCFDSSIQVWDAFGSLASFNQAGDLLGINVDGEIGKLNGNNGKYYLLTASGVQEMPKSYTTLTIKGNGNGHGVGMSQWGAMGMAANGKDYRSILEHFYNQNYYDGRLVVKAYATQ